MNQDHRLGIRRAIGVLVLAVGGVPAAQAATTQSRNTAFDYETASGLLTKELVEQGDANLCVVTAYTVDAWGNRVGATTRNCNGATGTYAGAVTEAAAPSGNAVFTARQTTTVYTADKRFVASATVVNTTNGLNQVETRGYDLAQGLLTSLTGPNGLTTAWAYDGLGRKVLEQRADGNGTKWSYDYCSGIAGGSLGCPTIAGAAGAYAVTTTPVAAPINLNAKTTGAANGPYVRVYYDALGREIRTETQGDDSVGASTLVYVDTQYNALGQVAQKSLPYYAGATPAWSIYTYDTLGRVTQEQVPDGGVTVTTYAGLTVSVKDALNHSTTKVTNLAGQVALVTDAKGGTLASDYDPYGNLVRSVDALGNVTSMEYDRKGRKTKLYDADMGVWTYAYSAVGELRQQTDAKGQVTTMSYDALGRLLSRSEPGLNSSWSYDKYPSDANGTSSCTKGLGKLCQASADNGYKRTHAYDGYGRPQTTTTTFPGTSNTYAATSGYDSHGRVTSVSYPGGLGVTNVYSALGYAKQVVDARNAGELFAVTANRNAAGQLTQYRYGNGVVTTQGYDALGRLKTSQAGTDNAVQNLSHAYNLIGGLTSRIDVLTGVTASYAYDDINRLLSETRSGGGLGGAQVISWTYDAIGNMSSRTESGSTNTYNYNSSGAGSSRPHAVASVSGTVNGVAAPIYSYDANGNLTGGAGRTVTWTGFDKVAGITAGAKQLTYLYDTEHERAQETYSVSGVLQRTTVYLNPGAGAGLFYEKETGTGAGGTGLKEKFYVNSPAGTIAMIVCTASPCTNTANSSTQYWHKDHLGSTSVVTNASGAVIERLAYEPFGKRRNSTGTTDPNGTLTPTSTDRGFTGHEHMDEVGLINMNGRIFDPGLGRFMSADPFIQGAQALQAYNRYSYGWNNPLNGADPSGYNWISTPWRDAWRNDVVQAVATIVIIWATDGCYSCAVAYRAGATWSRTESFEAGVKAGLITAASYWMNGVIGDWTSAAGMEIWNVAAHAAWGCVEAAASGGKCGAGALAGGVSAGISVYGEQMGLNTADWTKGERLVFHSLVGGTVSVIGGGKFANGAITAAFAEYFNAEEHRFKARPPEAAVNSPGGRVVDPTWDEVGVIGLVVPGVDLAVCAVRQCTAAQLAMAAIGAVPAGKGPALVVQFGRVENQVIHAFRHIEAAGLSREAVALAVTQDLSLAAQRGGLQAQQLHKGTVVVNGKTVNYNAMPMNNGVVNVGTISTGSRRR